MTPKHGFKLHTTDYHHLAMGNVSSSSPLPGASVPVYSGIDKLVAIFEGNQDHGISISTNAKWKDYLSNLTVGLLESPATDSCYVEAMHIFKDSAAMPYHEMLTFELASTSGKRYFMRVDRYVSNPTAEMFRATSTSTPSSPTSAADSQETLVMDSNPPQSSTQCHADHQAQIALRDICVEPSFVKALSASFSPRTASFRRLLDLLKLVADDYGEYNIWDRSCYWLSSIVYHTYVKEYPPLEETRGSAFSSIGKMSRTGRGASITATYLDDQGKLFDAWKLSCSMRTTIGKFVVRSKGKATLEYDRKRRSFIARTRIGIVSGVSLRSSKAHNYS